MRLLGAAGALAAVCYWAPAAALADFCRPGLVVRTAPVLARTGETVNVQIEVIRSIGPFNTVLAILQYPPDLTPHPDSTTLVPFPPGLFVRTSKLIRADPAARTLNVFVSDEDRITSNAEGYIGIVAEVPFTAPASPGAFSLSMTHAETQDAGGCCFQSPPSPGTFDVSASGGPGDVDGDGRVTAQDALWALRIVLGNATASPGVLRSLDVNRDGLYSVGDVVLILRMAAGLR